MEKDMKYYVGVSHEVMLANLNRARELVGPLFRRYRNCLNSDLCIIASGSSLNGALAAQPFMEKVSGKKVRAVSPTEYMDYQKEKCKSDFLIVISQSGCSTNIIEVAKDLNKDQREFAVLTGNLDADLKDYAETMIEYGVGNETVDYVTLGINTLMEYLMLFALFVGRDNGTITEKEYTTYEDQIKTACRKNRQMLEQSKRLCGQYYFDLMAMEKAVIVADGAGMGVAREAALKFQETLKIPTVYYESEEYIHGPNMQLTPAYAVFFIDTNPKHDRMYEVFKATRLVTKQAYYITDKCIGGDGQFLSVSEGGHVIHEISPLYTIVPFQWIAAAVTEEKNHFKCHPLFDKFDKALSCKTADYSEIMKEKLRKSKEEVQ